MHFVLEIFNRKFEVASLYRKVARDEEPCEPEEEIPGPDPTSLPHAVTERAYPSYEHPGANILPGRNPFGFGRHDGIPEP